MKALWASPEGKAKMAARNAKTAEMRAADPTKFSRSGVPNGMTKASVAPLVAKAHQLADRFIQKMKDEDVIPMIVIPDSDDARAEAALKAAVIIALSPGERQTQMAAIRTVLEYTKSKPATRSQITLDTTEQLLAEIARDAAEDS